MEHGSGVRRSAEKGEGQIGTIIGLLVFAAVCYAGIHVVPIFVTDYAFKDKLNELARLPRGQYKDETIVEMITKETRERGLDDVVQASDIKIHTVESSRRIYTAYSRTVKVLPGWEKTFSFEDDVSQPLIF